MYGTHSKRLIICNEIHIEFTEYWKTGTNVATPNKIKCRMQCNARPRATSARDAIRAM